MAKKPKPPTGKKDRQNWDRTVHWERTWARRARESEIIPGFVQNWRRAIFYAYKKGGLEAARKEHAQFVQFFKQSAEEEHLSAEEAEGAIENLDSFLNVLKKKQAKKKQAK